MDEKLYFEQIQGLLKLLINRVDNMVAVVAILDRLNRIECAINKISNPSLSSEDLNALSGISKSIQAIKVKGENISTAPPLEAGK